MLRRMLMLSLVGAAALTAAPPVPAQAQQRVLRHDEAAPGRLDPSKVPDYAAAVLTMNIYDSLVEARPGGGVMPGLATSWTISDDGKQYSFTLRPGVKFHHGGTVTAEDVVFTLDRTLTLNAGYARLFKGVSVSGPEPMKVVFTLPEANASFLASLVRMPIVQKSTVMGNIKPGGPYGDKGDYAEAWLAANDAGSGAYRVTEHNPQDGSVLVKFPDYFQGFADKAPDMVRIRYGIEAATIRTLMSRKEFEITSQWIPVEIKRALAGMPGMKLVTEAGISYFIMSMNTRRAPTDDVNIRRAIAKAIDYDTLIGMTAIGPGQPGALPMHGALPSGFLGYDKSLPANARDVPGAKAAVAASKYAGNVPPIELSWVAEVPLEEKFSLLIQQNLAEVGIPATIVKTPWALLTQQVTKPETTPHMTQRFAIGPYPDPDALISQNESRFLGTTLKMDWFADSELDRMIPAARAITDEAKRQTLYIDIQKRLLDQRPSLVAFESVATFAKQDYVTAPNLDAPGKGAAAIGSNWLFRTYSVDRTQ